MANASKESEDPTVEIDRPVSGDVHVLACQECPRVSSANARGWKAYRADDLEIDQPTTGDIHVLACIECPCVSSASARGWKAYRADEPETEEPPTLAFSALPAPGSSTPTAECPPPYLTVQPPAAAADLRAADSVAGPSRRGRAAARRRPRASRLPSGEDRRRGP